MPVETRARWGAPQAALRGAQAAGLLVAAARRDELWKTLLAGRQNQQRPVHPDPQQMRGDGHDLTLTVVP